MEISIFSSRSCREDTAPSKQATPFTFVLPTLPCYLLGYLILRAYKCYTFSLWKNKAIYTKLFLIDRIRCWIKSFDEFLLIKWLCKFKQDS
jgi:hypothetical protein